MYVSLRAAQARSIALSIVNGSITLIILLIAPLGIAAVILNTLLITIATFITSFLSDQVISYLTPTQQKAYLENFEKSSAIQTRPPKDLDKY